MALVFHKNLLSGHYQAVTTELLDRAGKHALSHSQIASLVGALSFLGRMDEAEALLERLESSHSPGPAAVAAHFFLGIGWTRKSKYDLARAAFAKNQEEAGSSALERFFVHQGSVFYAYYTGRFRAASLHAEKARRYALRSGNLFARALATDAYGHCRVVAGEIHHGLQLLAEARTLAERFGNGNFANAISVSLELYDAEFGLTGNTGLAKLEQRWLSVGTEDNYSLANVGLELARQFTWRGRFMDSARVLEGVAPTIYANQNRRQEILLNLRLAELACRRGDHFSSRHYLRFLHRLLQGEVDATFELAAVGLERKLAVAEGKPEEIARLTARWRKLAKDFGTTRDDHLRIRLGFLRPERENQEDLVHRILQSSHQATALSAKLSPLLQQGFLCAAADCLGLPPGGIALVVLPQSLGLLVSTGSELSWSPHPLSSLQTKILRLLTTGDSDKEKLVETIWGYRYAPLRHDPLVYSAMSSLRKSLGLAADWVQATEQGYRFGARLLWAQDEPTLEKERVPAPRDEPPTPPELLSQLNHRQLEILDWLREQRFLGVGECRKRFAVAEITALRDLDGLRRQGLVVRSGKARATRYTLPFSGASA